MSNKNINIISLFSGAGGLDLGFLKAGYNILDAAEFNKYAVQTHNHNFGLNSPVVDLENKKDYLAFINKNKDRNIELLIGGFPCQGFSLAGKRKNTDKRNYLYKKVISTLNDLKINYFILENVPGILSMNRGSTIKTIEKEFNDNGYFFKYKILDSSKYNVPQVRRRVIFIGSNSKSNFIKIDNIFNNLLKQNNKTLSVYDAIADLESSSENNINNHIFTRHTKEMIEKIKLLKEGESVYKNYSDGWKRLYYHKPSLTVKENHGGVHIHPKEDRVLTPRELARLQTFPDGFIFFGSKKDQLVQIGNAVPVEFARSIATAAKLLFENN